MNRAVKIGKAIRELAKRAGLEVTVFNAKPTGEVNDDVPRFIGLVQKADRLAKKSHLQFGAGYSNYAVTSAY
jgi:hypothetical protein